MEDIFEWTQTPAKNDVHVPVGFLICATKWRNTDITSSIQGRVQLMYQENLGVLDFYPSNRMGVVYVGEADLVTPTGYRRKLAQLRKANKIQVVVLVERTVTSTQYFSAAQKFCVLELGFTVLPVPSQKHAGSVLANMVQCEGHSDSNPFCRKKKPISLDQALLNTVQSIPKLGHVKATALLENYKSINSICQASFEELSLVIGKASAHHVQNFFGDK